MTTTNIDIDDDLHAALRDEAASMKDLVNDALREKMGIEDLTSADAVERRISKKTDELREARTERERLEAREDKLESEIERLEEKLETIEANSQSLIESLDEILDDMVSSRMHVFADLPVVQRAATEHGVTVDEVMQALQDRAEERGLNIDAARFAPKTEAVKVEQ